MTQIKTGNSNEPRFELPQIFDIRVPGPIDSRMTIDSISSLSVELPLGVRYLGQFVWVQDISSYYHFKNGLTNSDFVPFELSSSTAKFVFTSTVIIENGDLLTHGLNSNNFTIQFFLDNKPVTIDFEFLELDPAFPTTYLNSIQLNPPLGYQIPSGLIAIIVN